MIEHFEQGLRAGNETIEYDETYMIAITARVGSTALVSGLQSAGLSDGRVREIFNPRWPMQDLQERFQARSLIGYLNACARDCGGSRLVFKTNWIDLAPALEDFGGNLDALFPRLKIVYMERGDRLAQAYSLWKANRHNVWALKADVDYASPVREPVPIDEIRQKMDNLASEALEWEAFFEANGIGVERCLYEDFQQNPEAVIAKVYEYFSGLPLTASAGIGFKRSFDDTDRSHLEDLRRRLAEASSGPLAAPPSTD